jgi:homeobox protein ESX1
VKFSDLLGDPEPEREEPKEAAADPAAPAPESGSEPITVFAPVPTAPPRPEASRPDPPRLDPSNPIPPPPLPAVEPRSESERAVPPIPPLPPLPPLRPHEVTTETAAVAARVPTPSTPPPPIPPVPAATSTPVASAPNPATPSGLLPGGRSGLAELNVRQPPGVPIPTADSSVSDQLTGLSEIVDDLLPSSKRGRK